MMKVIVIWTHEKKKLPFFLSFFFSLHIMTYYFLSKTKFKFSCVNIPNEPYHYLIDGEGKGLSDSPNTSSTYRGINRRAKVFILFSPSTFQNIISSQNGCYICENGERAEKLSTSLFCSYISRRQ